MDDNFQITEQLCNLNIILYEEMLDQGRVVAIY